DLARNAGLPDYRAYRWQQLNRFDYTPDDCKGFHRAVEEVVVPARTRLLEKRRRQMGVDALRPWDLRVDPSGKPPLRPFANIEELTRKTSAIFHHVDPDFGAYFDIMVAEDLLDLETRKNKATSGYSLPFNATHLPFIFLSMAGTHGDVVGLLHEGGHAFHTFEASRLPYFQQRDTEAIAIEFAEVASTAMELLASPYLEESKGGFYTRDDAARALEHHLAGLIEGWCAIATIDAFQHWIYENPEQAKDGDALDAQYVALTQRFLPGVDYTGLVAERSNEWRRIPHPFEVPFYFVEYALAEMGAVQIWAGARRDQREAVRRYREALKLGHTVPVPQLFETAGARLAFDAGTLRELVDLLEEALDDLEARQTT
ncbi:MAG: M3 family oligoendopeptidase, partial [Chloroflexi bacterium]